MSGLDATDLAILRILQEDAALTNKQVAARVHLSPTPVFESIKRLEQDIDHVSVDLDLTVPDLREYILHVMGEVLHPLVSHGSCHTL